IILFVIRFLVVVYFNHEYTIFRYFNIIMIPITLLFQNVLVTSTKSLNWSKLSYIRLVTGKILDAFQYLVNYLSVITRRILRRNKKESSGLIRQVILGMLIALQILFIVVNILMAEDA